MLVVLPPPVARRPQMKGLRREVIVHVAAQDAILDEHVARWRVALVIHIDAPAARRQQAIVHDGAERRGHPVAHPVAVVRGLLPVEVGLESVADRLVQQNARVAVAEHHRHRTGRRLLRIEHRHRNAGCLGAKVLRRVGREVLESHTAAAALHARLAPPFALRHHAHIEAQHGLVVRDELAVARHNQNLLARLGQRHGDPLHPLVVAACGSVGAAEQVELAQRIGFEGGLPDRVERECRHAVQLDAPLEPAAHRDRGGRLCRAEQTLGRQVFGVGVARSLARQHPHAAAQVDGPVDLLDAPVVEHHDGRDPVLKVEVGMVAAARESAGEHLAAEVGIDAKMFEVGKMHAVCCLA